MNIEDVQLPEEIKLQIMEALFHGYCYAKSEHLAMTLGDAKEKAEQILAAFNLVYKIKGV